MSGVERWACSNPAWRAFTGRAVIPWVLAGQQLDGDVLELGTGAGANAQVLLARFPRMSLTATDVDPAMLGAARHRLAPFAGRATVEPADAAALAFGDASFDAVLSLLMLHHIGDWRGALSQVVRVLRPGGRLIGYDLTRSGSAARLHRHNHPGHNPATVEELRQGLSEAGFTGPRLTPALGGRVARFAAVKK
jgi:ubiquinone/menaquinone biosynthesis C-methylase UbiE